MFKAINSESIVKKVFIFLDQRFRGKNIPLYRKQLRREKPYFLTFIRFINT